MVSVMMTVRAAIPPNVIPASIISCGGISVRSRPINVCHWISQLVPTKEMIAPNRATNPPVKRNTRTACNEGACEEEGLSASVLPTMCCAISFSFFYECLRDILLKKRGFPSTPLIPCLRALMSGRGGLSGRQRMIGQLGSRRAFGLEQRQGALVQDEPARRTQVSVDHVAHQVMHEAIAGRPTCPGFLFPQEATLDGLLQGFHACLPSQHGDLPQAVGARRGAQHGTGPHQLARWR